MRPSEGFEKALFEDIEKLNKLPFEKKIEIVVELQKAAAGIREDVLREAWPI